MNQRNEKREKKNRIRRTLTLRQKRVLIVCALLAVSLLAFFAISRNYKRKEIIAKGGFVTDELGIRYFYPGYQDFARGQKRIDGEWYMFDLTTGVAKVGLYQHSHETNPNGGPKLCYYDEQGRMFNGIKRMGDDYYYFSPKDGAMKTGLVEVVEQDKLCYFDEEGRMQFGYIKVENDYYYFDMVTGAMLNGAGEAMTLSGWHAEDEISGYDQ